SSDDLIIPLTSAKKVVNQYPSTDCAVSNGALIVATKPVSSKVSLIAHSSSVSPGSCLPPGIPQRLEPLPLLTARILSSGLMQSMPAAILFEILNELLIF